MKKQTMIVSLAALALLVSPLGNMGGLTRVSAEEQQGAELYSVSGSDQGAGTVVSVSMVRFYDNYWGMYSVENTTDSYIHDNEDVVLEKDGEILARANGMTVSELAAKNPQIKNLNKIIPGQIIYIK